MIPIVVLHLCRIKSEHIIQTKAPSSSPHLHIERQEPMGDNQEPTGDGQNPMGKDKFILLLTSRSLRRCCCDRWWAPLRWAIMESRSWRNTLQALQLRDLRVSSSSQGICRRCAGDRDLDLFNLGNLAGNIHVDVKNIFYLLLSVCTGAPRGGDTPGSSSYSSHPLAFLLPLEGDLVRL